MHSGCSGKFDDGKQIADKLRMMGFSDGLMPPVSLTEILPVSGTHNGKVKGLILHCHMKSLLI